jgi:hypothetical protein
VGIFVIAGFIFYQRQQQQQMEMMLRMKELQIQAANTRQQATPKEGEEAAEAKKKK